jgi:hypothetical protein
MRWMNDSTVWIGLSPSGTYYRLGELPVWLLPLNFPPYINNNWELIYTHEIHYITRSLYQCSLVCTVVLIQPLPVSLSVGVIRLRYLLPMHPSFTSPTNMLLSDSPTRSKSPRHAPTRIGLQSLSTSNQISSLGHKRIIDHPLDSDDTEMIPTVSHPLQSPAKRRAVRPTTDKSQQRQQDNSVLFLSPILPHKSSSITPTPIVPFTPALNHSTSSLLNSSNVDERSFGSSTLASPVFASPLHPQQLSFDSVSSPSDSITATSVTSSAFQSPVSIAPFSFAAGERGIQNSGLRMSGLNSRRRSFSTLPALHSANLAPSLSSSPSPSLMSPQTSPMMNPVLPPLHSTHMRIPHSNGHGSAAELSFLPLDALNEQSSTPPQQLFTIRVNASSPSTATVASSLPPTHLHHHRVPSDQPHSASTDGSISGRTGPTGHRRSNSTLDITRLPSNMRAAGVKHRVAPLLTLNSKRHRGNSMDLQAEHDSGASIPLPSPTNNTSTADHFFVDPHCPASAITLSMRKMRVKKSEHTTSPMPLSHVAAASSIPIPLPTLDEPDRRTHRPLSRRRACAFDSSDDDGEENVQPMTTPLPIAPPSNLKEQRRQQQMHSIQKKRADVLREMSGNTNAAISIAPNDTLSDQDDAEAVTSAQQKLVNALTAAAVNPTEPHQQLTVPEANTFQLHSPLRRQRGSANAEESGEVNSAVPSATTPVLGPGLAPRLPITPSSAFKLHISIPRTQEESSTYTGASSIPPVARQLGFRRVSDDELLAASHPLHSPPLASGAMRLKHDWEMDDDDEDDTSVGRSLTSSAISVHSMSRMRMPETESLPAAALTSSAFFGTLSGGAQQLRQAQAQLAICEEDVRGVATQLDFTGAEDDDAHGAEACDLVETDMLPLICHQDREERRSRRCGSVGALVLPEGMSPRNSALTPTHLIRSYSNNGMGSGSSGQQGYSPVPQHTPLTPVASSFSCISPRYGSYSLAFEQSRPASAFQATPVPMLPSMVQMPDNRLPEEVAAEKSKFATQKPAALRIPDVDGTNGNGPPSVSSPLPEGFTESDFLSPVNTSVHHMFFPTSGSGNGMSSPTASEDGSGMRMPPQFSPASSAFRLEGLPQSVSPMVHALSDASMPAEFNSEDRAFARSLSFGANTNGLDQSFAATTAPNSTSHSAAMTRTTSLMSEFSTPPRSPIRSASDMNHQSGGIIGLLSMPNLAQLLTPDPKAFQESRSLQSKQPTPVRSFNHGVTYVDATPEASHVRSAGMLGADLFPKSHHISVQKQPPPTPLRPTTIKRLRPAERGGVISAATPAKPFQDRASSLQKSSNLLLAAATTSSLDSPPATHSQAQGSFLFGTQESSQGGLSAAIEGSPTLPPPAFTSKAPPSMLPACHSRTRFERASSLYDNKVLIDFKAAVKAAAELKAKRSADARRASAAAAGIPYEEHIMDISMDDSSPGISLNNSPQQPPAPTNADAATTSNNESIESPTSDSGSIGGPSLTDSIWSTSFCNKQLVGSGSFFETFRCLSCARSGPRAEEFRQFFAVKRSIRAFRGKKDRGVYLREIALMELLGDHENIVRHIRAWQEDLHFFVQMEYCSMNLTQYVQTLHAEVNAAAANGTLDSLPAEVTAAVCMTETGSMLSDALLQNITLQLACALHHVHSRGLVHLDVKPDNVLVTNSGILRLADFGQARLLQPAQVPGSPNPLARAGAAALAMCPDFDMDGVEGDSVYMAPELLGGGSFGGPTSPRSGNGPSFACDMFSLGLLLVELSSGVVLPKSGPLWHELREGKANKHIHGRVSAQIEKLILNLLDPRPSKRPNAKTLIDWLQTHKA